MNKLYQQMQTQQAVKNLSSNSNFANIKQMVNMFKMATNPQQVLNNLINQNPQVKQAMQLINSSGKNPKDLFYEVAQQQGVDPNEILKLLQ